MNTSRPRRIAVAIVVQAFVLGYLVLAGLPAAAVHELGIMEVSDGNVADGTAGDPRDWAAFYGYNAGTGTYTTTAANFPAGTGDDSGVIPDFVAGANSDPTYHEPSNKDDQAINAAGASGVWGCGSAANATDKTDILNAYAIAVRPTSGAAAGDQLIYFGVERYDNSGDAFLGLWFFQDEVACDTATGKFTGSKQTGDVLLLVNFTNGGASTTVTAFEYTEHPTSPDSQAGTLTLVGTTSLRCSQQGAGAHDFCAETNGSTFTTPWPHPDKDKPEIKGKDPANQVDALQFFEGGINLTEAFDLSSPICISSFIAETRSSSSVDATLKDFVRGDLNTCGTLEVKKYHDKDANGSRDPNGADDVLGGTGAADDEVLLDGWKIFLDDGDGVLETEDADCDGILDASEDGTGGFPDNDVLDGEICAVTGAGGATGTVTFSNVQAGAYTVCEVQMTGWFRSDPATSTVTGKDCQSATVGNEGTTTSKIFGNYTNGTKSGVKFNDVDSDGVKDSGEGGLNGWVIRVYKDADKDGVLEDADDGTADSTFTHHLQTTTATTTVNSVSVDGYYSFSLAPGWYFVCEVTKDATWAQTYPKTTTTGYGDCSAPSGLEDAGWLVKMLSGQTHADNDFGNAQLHKILVIVCHEDNTLVNASVTVDSVTKRSVITGDLPGGVTQANVCGLGGSSTTFGGKIHETESVSVAIPASGTGSGH